jgi:PAS domain-containing protein
MTRRWELPSRSSFPPGGISPLPHIIETFAYQVTIWMRRQQFERELRESEARFRSLFQNIGDAFVLLDEQPAAW